MKLFRKEAMRKWGMFIASLIILTFMLWGTNAGRLGDSDNRYTYAGKIFGKTISFEEYDKNFKQVQIQAMIRYGENFRRIQNMLNLDGQAWDRMILLYEAGQRRIKVSDEDVRKAIENYGFVNRSGNFDPQIYDYVIRGSFRTSPRNFEEGIRDTLKIAQIFEAETADVKIKEQEALEAYRTKNEKVQISYAFFSPENVEVQVAPNEDQLQEYFAAHKDDFLMPPTINVEYMQVDVPRNVKNPAETKDQTGNEEIAAEEEAADTAAWEKAQNIYESIKAGKDFYQAAQENSLTVAESGNFSLEQPFLKPGWSFALIQKLFTAPAGQIFEPVETQGGYQVLRVKVKNDAYIPEYAQARDKVTAAWTKHQTKQLAREAAEASRAKLVEEFEKYKHPDFAQIAKSLNLNIMQTPAFSQGEYIPNIGVAKDFQIAAFSLTAEKSLSEIIETPKGFCILHLDSRIPADMKEFEKDKEKITEILLLEKRATAFNEFLSRLRIKANLEDNIAKMKAGKSKPQPVDY